MFVGFIFLCRDQSPYFNLMNKCRIMESFKVSGQIVDVVAGRVYAGEIEITNGHITSITEDRGVVGPLIIPGLVDSHIHIESSMLIPSEFARLAVVHGTTSVVADPHEIANVLGMDGIRFMIQNGLTVPFNFYFGAPSCVPATTFETSGAILGPEEVDELLSWPEIKFLSEMMNFPGVLQGDKSVLAKIASAVKHGKPVDGHAPGLMGEDAVKYAKAGVTTDHECFTTNEAIGKIKAGMKILIREGSAARNFDDLIELIVPYPQMIMFCSDDKHPDDLVKGHLNLLIKKAIVAGYPFMDVIRACTLNPVRHYHLDSGLLQKGDKADFILVDNVNEFNVLSTYVSGRLVAEKGVSLIKGVQVSPVNNFNPLMPQLDDLKVEAGSSTHINVIQAIDGQLITRRMTCNAKIVDGEVVSDIKNDLLKMVVVNRYHQEKPSISFVNGFNLKAGAIASSVAHDSHNIIAIGADDHSLLRAISIIMNNRGGICFYTQEHQGVLPLPVAGLMSMDDGYQVAEQYQLINKAVHTMGTALESPFMTLSFMSLLVIPELKLSDKGLFNSRTFSYTKLLD